LPIVSPLAGGSLRERLDQLRGRIERAWQIKLKIEISSGADAWPDALANEVYRLIQEAVLNAARHADASMINVNITSAGGPCLEITDDGRGFPFRGTYDLRALNEMNSGPLTLRERVAGLRGDLHLRSTDAGSELLIRLPTMKQAAG
jgi:signal transduction histidine kinase